MRCALVGLALLPLAAASNAATLPIVCDPSFGGSTSNFMIGKEIGGVGDSFEACASDTWWDGIGDSDSGDGWAFAFDLAFAPDGDFVTAHAELELNAPEGSFVGVTGTAGAFLTTPPGPRAFQDLVVEVARSGDAASVGISTALLTETGDTVASVDVGALPDGVHTIPLPPLGGETIRLRVFVEATLEDHGAVTADVRAAVDVPEPVGALALAVGASVLAVAGRRPRYSQLANSASSSAEAPVVQSSWSARQAGQSQQTST